ncbi:MAG: MBL fold metallo-hydrolase [Bacteroidaceae bacterium]|jgi:glyoxylase-like metal-dependent hydrolase (beta-lactamase superfamily II)|nr:MBL fold metallo-hydrolase [Bacteroidaceae bacterium]
MIIKAIRMFDGGFMNQQFAFGGEEGKDKFDEQIIYRSSLQNFLIETGSEVILVDTGFKTGYVAPAKKLGAPLFMGEKVADYMDAFAASGYKPEQVTKILITHKHPDHSDCIKEFHNAKVYIAPEDADAMKLEGEKIVRAQYGKVYKNFPNAQQVADGIWFIEAKGHTKGNSIIIAENDGLYYMFHGDVTYCDAALKANKLSIVFEDKEAARQTLDRVRQFIKDNPTVYLSTHCPEGYENLEMKRIMKL